MNVVLLTGSTGSFGSFLAHDLLKKQSRVILLVRAKTKSDAEKRVSNVLRNYSGGGGKIQVFRCDLSAKNLGLANTDQLYLHSNVTHILHAAASTRFNLPLLEARRNNVTSTRNLLAFARSCIKLERFGFVSTAFVAGRRSGLILEDEFVHSTGFLNTYEESKYEAERTVRDSSKNLKIVIFRPSLIITPFIKSGPVHALTFGFFLIKKGFLPILPGNANNLLDIIEPIIASDAIVQVFLKQAISYSTYHVTSAKNSPKIHDLLLFVEKQIDKKLPLRFYGDMDSFSAELKKVTRFRPYLATIYKKTESFLPELAYPKIFDNAHLLRELQVSNYSSRPIDGLPSLLK